MKRRSKPVAVADGARRQPPYRFNLYGKTWRVHFVDPMKVPRVWSKRERDFIRRNRITIHGVTISARSTGRRDIYIRPQDKGDWAVFAHEVMHALEEEMGEHRRERGWLKRPITHGNFHRLAVPLGEFLRSNLPTGLPQGSRRPRRRRRRNRRTQPGRRTGSS